MPLRKAGSIGALGEDHLLLEVILVDPFHDVGHHVAHSHLVSDHEFRKLLTVDKNDPLLDLLYVLNGVLREP